MTNKLKQVWENGAYGLPNEDQYEKQNKKQKLVRNQFASDNYYGIPIIKKQSIDLKDFDVVNYTKTKLNDKENACKAVHFFTYDWKYDSVYENPEKAMEKLYQYKILLTPDFSIYTDMPKVVQIMSIFKKHWCGAYWQAMDKKVIPTIEWGDKDSYEFCFEGVEKGSVVAVSTYRRGHLEKEYIKGYDKMLEIIEPQAVICYGEPFREMSGNILVVDPFNKEELIKKIGIAEFAKKYIAGELYPEK